MSLEHMVETDVLVIGGGIAGCFASMKAKEQGLDVTMEDFMDFICVHIEKAQSEGKVYIGNNMFFLAENVEKI
jgi:succinate dehydrogenase/fumarate reductase flavoprotein subunit